MMRSPYQSPKEEAPSRFLRRRPEERRKLRYVYVGLGLLGAWLTYSFLLSDTGLLRIAALRRENETLRDRQAVLSERVTDLERRRKEQAKDPLLEERVARERFHLVKKDEIVYRYRESASDSLR
ncbi:MAG TPA: septum formation initiator family protein [Candidatus Eisenbacteria bacterium]|nr:septum formation initiator family protein [Candidatus Eisenbacteria bacterium]